MSIFANVPPIRYEGPDAANEFAYRVYDKNRQVLGKRMEDWLRPAVCYWHSFSSAGADMFGGGTLLRPWQDSEITQDMALQKLEAAFDFMSRLGLPYFTFHDADVMATARNLRAHARNLRHIEEDVAVRMASTGVKLLWGTANLFSHPRYAAGAATSPDPEVFAYAAAQVRTAWKPRIASAARTTCCGVAVKATTHCSTPISRGSSTSTPASSRWWLNTNTGSASRARS